MQIYPTMDSLEITNLHKSFGATRALAGISFQVRQGEIVALLGPSGCGKSTLLAIIAGLEKPDQGEVLWDGSNLESVPPHRRDFGLMFQDFALFPHRDVFANVAFGLQMAHIPAIHIQQRVKEVLELVGLSGFERRDVNTLSGGESQRVALARSLAPRPRLLMLDEPLGSLDRNLRERLVLDLREILRRSQQTALYVTHDQEEAFVLADRVVVMNTGQVEQVGAPQHIYRWPASLFVARFLGLNNLLSGEVAHDGQQQVVNTPIGSFPIDTPLRGPVTVLLRPDAVRLEQEGACLLRGTVIETSFRGSTWRAKLEVAGIPLTFDLPANLSLPDPGEALFLCFEPGEALQVYPGS